MTRKITLLPLIFLFSVGAASASSECRSALSEKGEVQLFNSTICPSDIAASKLYELIPADIAGANILAPIEYHEQISKSVTEKRKEETSPYKSPAARSTALKDLYEPIFYIALSLAMLALAIEAFKSKTSETKEGNLKRSIARVVLLALLAVPISVKVDGVGTHTTLIQSAFARLHLFAIGTANSFSAAATSGLSNPKDYVVLDTSTKGGNTESMAIDSARAYIEEAVCIHNTALANISRNAEKDGISADRSLRSGGELYVLSQSTDGTQSAFEVFKDDNELRSGWSLHDIENAQVCVTRSLDAPIITETTEELSKEIFNIASKLELTDVKQSSIEGAWNDVFGIIANKTKEEQEAYADYFFSVLRWRVEGGDALDNRASAESLQSRFDLAKAFVKEYVADSCMAVRSNYMDTEKTISYLNNGSIQAPSFNLDCAIIEDGELAMAYEADSSDPNAYVSDVAKLKASHPVKLLDMHRALVESFKPLELVQAAYEDSLKQIAVRIAEKSDNKSESLGNEVKEARFAGYIGVARSYLSIVEADAITKDAASDERVVVQALDGVTTDSNMSIEKGFLPITSELSADRFILPSFIYAKPLELNGEENVSEVVEESYFSQLMTGQGGNTDSDIKSSGVQYLEVGADSATTHDELVDAAIVSVFDRLSALGKPLESTSDEYNATELMYLVEKMCIDITTTKGDVAALGVSIEDYNAVCEAHFSNALIANKKNAYQLVGGMTDLAVIGTSSTAGFVMSKAIMKKYKGSSADKQKVAPKETAFFEGIGLPTAGAAGYVADKVKGLYSSFYNSAAIAGISGIVIGGGTLIAMISLVSSALPNLLFEFFTFSSFAYIYLLSLLSPLLILWIMVVGLDEQRNTTLKDWIVRSFVQPVLGIIMLVVAILLSSLAAKINNAVVGTMMGSSRDFSLANPESIIIGLIVLLATTGTYFFILWHMLKTSMDYSKEVMTWFSVKASKADDSDSSTMPLTYAMDKVYDKASDAASSYANDTLNNIDRMSDKIAASAKERRAQTPADGGIVQRTESPVTKMKESITSGVMQSDKDSDTQSREASKSDTKHAESPKSVVQSKIDRLEAEEGIKKDANASAGGLEKPESDEPPSDIK